LRCRAYGPSRLLQEAPAIYFEVICHAMFSPAHSIVDVDIDCNTYCLERSRLFALYRRFHINSQKSP
jgi:hypothetical protein